MNLRKISDGLYEEDLEQTSQPLKWFKGREWLILDLFGIQSIDGIVLNDPRVSVQAESRQGNIRRITANGHIENKRRLCLLNPVDGEQHRFDEIDVTVHLDRLPFESTVAAPHEAPREGALVHICDDLLKFEFTQPRSAFIHLELYAPEKLFAPLWGGLVSGEKIAKVSLSAYVDVFRSELDRSLAEPYNFQEYYIERSSGNAAFLASFQMATEPIIKRKITGD